MNANPSFYEPCIAGSRAVALVARLILIPCFWASVSDVSALQFGLFTYVANETSVTITDYPTNATGPVEIPAEIENLPVTAIGFEAFAGCAGVTSVAMPATLTSIADRAFINCTGLTSAPIPAAVTSLGVSAFAYCSNLTEMAVPGGITQIPNSLFLGCTTLASVTLPPGISSIGNSAFDSCSVLVGLTIPDTVESIGNGAFIYCYGLTGMVLPEGLETIGTSAFANCANLASVSLPSSLTVIGASAFSSCAVLASVNISSEVTAPSNLKTIGNNAFFQCILLSAITLPTGLETIENAAFRSCMALTSVSIPASVTTIGTSEVFRNCSSLTSIFVDAANPNYASVGGVLFDKSLSTLISYPGGLTATSYSIPEGVSAIASTAFRSCTRFTSVVFPGSLVSIGANAFSGCTALTSVVFPVSVTSVGNSAFSDCAALTAATFSGNAPGFFGSTVFSRVGSGFKIYYNLGVSGFTSPTWKGYATIQIGATNPIFNWLVAYGLAGDLNPGSDANGDGVSLLMAYALDLNPNHNLSSAVPRPVFTASQMSLSYFSASAGVGYVVEASADLVNWSTEGVVIGLPNASNVRKATVDRTGDSRFMRLSVSY